MPDWNDVIAEMDVADILARDDAPVDRREPRDPDAPGDAWSGSQVADVCARQEALLALDGQDRAETHSVETRAYFAFGDGIHRALQDGLLADRLLGEWICLGCGAVHGDEETLVVRPEACDGRRWDRDAGEWRPCPNRNWAEDVETDYHLPGFRYGEIEVTADDPRIVSHPDGALWVGEGAPPERASLSDPYVDMLEIKSATKNCLDYGFRGSDPWREAPWGKHAMQLQIPMYLTDCEHGRVLYVNKGATGVDDGAAADEMLIDHRLELDASAAKRQIDKLRAADRAIREADPLEAPRECSYEGCGRSERCPVSEQCWNLERERDDSLEALAGGFDD